MDVDGNEEIAWDGDRALVNWSGFRGARTSAPTVVAFKEHGRTSGTSASWPPRHV
jgi:hypothetical protein